MKKVEKTLRFLDKRSDEFKENSKKLRDLNAALDELTNIEGFDEDLASELSNRAKNFVKLENRTNLVITFTLGFGRNSESLASLFCL